MANEKLVTRETAKKVVEGYTQELEQSKITVGISKNIAPISEESGTIQETPFILQGTGTANNTDSVDTSPVGKQLEKQGNTVCVNQLKTNNNFSSTSGWSADPETGSISVNNNVLTITASSGNRLALYTNNIKFVNGHKYLFFVKLKNSSAGHLRITLLDGSTYAEKVVIQAQTELNTTEQSKTYIFTSNLTGNGRIFVYTYLSGDINDTVSTQYTKYNLIDLTQWFNGDIPQDLLDNPSHWSWYQNYGDYIAYNTGTLVNCAGRYLVNTYRNQWDEETILGNYSTTTGAFNVDTTHIACKNKIRVIGGKTYYFYTHGYNANVCILDKNNTLVYNSTTVNNSTILVPANGYYMVFNLAQAYGTTYKNDITISLYYATGDGYTDYYPYQEPSVYDTGVEVLRKAGNYKDTKAPDGTITRRIGVVDLGTLTWGKDTLSGDTNYFYSTAISGIKKPSSNNDIPNVLCALFTKITRQSMNSVDGLAITTGGRVNIRSAIYNSMTYTQFQTALSGVYLYYELATPTTEQGTPFTENINIDDYGTMAWLDTDNNYVVLPQGTKLFYPAWYVGFIDSLGQRSDVDWDAGNVISQTQLSTVDTKHDSLYAIMQENVGGALRHTLCVKGEISNFDNTAFIDLGSVNWSYSDGKFSANIPHTDIDFYTPAKILCTKYRNVSANGATNLDKVIYSANTNYINVKDTTYTDATAFKNAMKGVLLAYEKAS